MDVRINHDNEISVLLPSPILSYMSYKFWSLDACLLACSFNLLPQELVNGTPSQNNSLPTSSS
eukprot:6268933-Amphidinium_carterae.1